MPLSLTRYHSNVANIEHFCSASIFLLDFLEFLDTQILFQFFMYFNHYFDMLEILFVFRILCNSKIGLYMIGLFSPLLMVIQFELSVGSFTIFDKLTKEICLSHLVLNLVFSDLCCKQFRS
jgi:hypothetical protein